MEDLNYLRFHQFQSRNINRYTEEYRNSGFPDYVANLINALN
jgi:hypothetical protein